MKVLSVLALVLTAAPATAQVMTVRSSAPLLRPEEAVRVLQRIHSIVDRTNAGLFAIEGPEVSIIPHDRYWPFSGPPPALPQSLSGETVPFVAPYWQTSAWQSMTGVHFLYLAGESRRRNRQPRTIDRPANPVTPRHVTQSLPTYGVGRRVR